MVVLNTVWRLEDEAPRAPERERGPERVGRVITLSIDSLFGLAHHRSSMYGLGASKVRRGDTKAR